MADEREGPILPGEEPEEISTPDPAVERRAASVVFRGEGASEAGEGSLLDPANQSLADALRITFRLVVTAMFVLAGLFVLSGLRSVQEGERGIRVRNGAITGRNLPPGFHLSWPYPVGELRSYARTPPQLELREEFWFFHAGEDRPLEQMASAARDRLTPGRDGAVITAGLDLAHTRWTVQYTRDDVVKFATNILEEEEQTLVRAAVQRGVVQSMAGTTLDELLTQTSEGSSATERVREVAQRMLSDLESGITITRVTLAEKAPPLRVYTAYNQVTDADQNAARTLEDARSARATALTQTAGAAHPYLIDQIDRYEAAVEIGDGPEQARILDTIYGLMEGRVVEIDGEMVQGLSSGEVRRMMDRAEQYRTEVVSEARGDLTRFDSLADQFRDNPAVVVTREWADSIAAFMDYETVSVMYAPPGAESIEYIINMDPDIEKEIETETNRQRAAAARERRIREAEESRLRPSDARQLSAEPN